MFETNANYVEICSPTARHTSLLGIYGFVPEL